MAGVDILNTEEILTFPIWSIVCLSVSLTILFISFLCLIKSIAANGRDSIVMLIGVIGVISGICTVVFACLCTENKTTGRYRYEATIDESVLITEVYERYKVIEQRGDIWVLEDKEDE